MRSFSGGLGGSTPRVGTGAQQYASLAGKPWTAVPLGDKQVVTYVCHDEDELDCDLTLSDVTYRDR